MKRLWLAIVGFAAVVMSSALAADMPSGRHMRPPRTPTDVPIFSWNGLYAGINGGYGFGHSTWIETSTLATTGSFSTTGALIGGTFGYNLQLNTIVVGLETDIDSSSISGCTTNFCGASECKTTNTAREQAIHRRPEHAAGTGETRAFSLRSEG